MPAQPEVYLMISPRCSVHHFTGIQKQTNKQKNPKQNKSTEKIVVIATVAINRGNNNNKIMLINKTLDLNQKNTRFFDAILLAIPQLHFIMHLGWS